MSMSGRLRNCSECLPNVIERIPQSNQEAISVELLPEQYHSQCQSCIVAVSRLLQLFDAITLFSDNNGKVKIKAKSETATYFLRSLSRYLRQNLTLVSNWEREGIGEDLRIVDALASGAHFVYLMEYKRVSKCKDTKAIRQVELSVTPIKAKVRGKRGPLYLVQYDEKAHQFQPIGGRKRSSDSNALTVMRREIPEELAKNRLEFEKDFTLQELTRFQGRVISRTYGAYTDYYMTVYQTLFKRSQLVLGPNDRWVTLGEIQEKRTKDGMRISSILCDIDRELPGGLMRLSLSLEKTQKRPLRQIILERKWEIAGLTVAIISVILTVLFFELS